ncbi:MAG: AsmA family protein [Candidatus Zixiibacteriota bacterium]
MKRSLRILILVVGVLVFLAVLAIIVAKFVFTKQRILALLSPRIEAMLHRPVRIDDAGITFWGGIGVRLTGITIGNRPGFSQQPFLSVEALDVKARFWPLLVGRAEVDHVRMEHPAVTIEYDAMGGSNLDGLLATSTSTPGEPAQVADSLAASRLFVQHVIIAGGRFSLRDARVPRRLDAGGLNVDLRLSPPVESQELPFAIGVSFDSLEFVQKDRHWSITSGDPRCLLSGEWNRRSGSLRADSLALRWWGVTVLAQGSMRSNPGLREIEVNARLLPTPVQDILPEIQRLRPMPLLAGLEATAQGSAEATFVWPLPQGRLPEWRMVLDLSDLAWTLPGNPPPMTASRVELRGGGQTISWAVTAGRFGDGTFATTGTVDQVFTGQRTLSGRLEADMPVSGLEALMPSAHGLSTAGRIKADITGFADLAAWQTAQFTGHLTSDRLAVTDTAWTVDSVAAALDIELAGADIAIRRCDWRAGDSHGAMTGQIADVVPCVLSRFKSPDVPRAELTITCGRLDLDQMIGEEPPPSDVGSAVAVALAVPPVVANGEVSSDTVIYSGLTLTQVRSQLQLKNNVLILDPIDGEVLGGHLLGSLVWDISTWPDPVFRTSLRADSIETNDLLARYFGWAGGVFGQAAFQGEFSGHGRYARDILPALTAAGSLDLSSGRLEAAPLLAKIGEQIGIKGLDRPRSIRDLGLPFRIASGQIITDRLTFTTDEAQYSATGSFGFDHTLDYKVKITPCESAGMPRSLAGAGVKFDLGGTVAEPIVRVDLRETGQTVLKNLREAASDTLRKGIDKALKNLLKGPKP